MESLYGNTIALSNGTIAGPLRPFQLCDTCCHPADITEDVDNIFVVYSRFAETRFAEIRFRVRVYG